MSVALLALAVGGLASVQVQGGCPTDCSCPREVLKDCAPGVPLVSDDCGCGCQVCAGQLNDECSALRPCDPGQDLICDYGAAPQRAWGICRASQQGRSCFFNGSVYLHEEHFQIACHSSCACRDGALGCVPLCPLTMPVIVPGCSNMRPVEVPGQCCKQWECVESNRLEDWPHSSDMQTPPWGNAIGENPGGAWGAETRPSWDHHPLAEPSKRRAEMESEESQALVAEEEDADGSSAGTPEGRPCTIQGATYQHGEHFQIGCRGSCVCQDGSMVCVSLCPPTQPAPVPGCLVMGQVEVPGQCCKQWRCLEFSNVIHEETAETPWGAQLLEDTGLQMRSRSLPSWRAEVTRRKRVNDMRTSSGMQSYRCQKEPTEWTHCSKTCGTGISTRLIWINGSCTPRVQRRVCMIRPCGQFLKDGQYTVIKGGKKCARLVRPADAETWTFKGCQTQRPLMPNYCGYCTNGRSCVPSKTHTVPLKFQCEGGAEISRKVMWVLNCICKETSIKKKPKGLQQKRRAQEASRAYLE
ncbi:hypothetical protein NDU88_000797 [Pleurodeles waltl]|uniref:Connective tissue growth factor n=1 Tax=Pleurodeles waltl TaxID=8319 RepID=A0AAV7Q8C4_PLEWA|nr:hypothetical protein NDU88_000797 [Pleurodeles waltl]